MLYVHFLSVVIINKFHFGLLSNFKNTRNTYTMSVDICQQFLNIQQLFPRSNNLNKD